MHHLVYKLMPRSHPSFNQQPENGVRTPIGRQQYNKELEEECHRLSIENENLRQDLQEKTENTEKLKVLLVDRNPQSSLYAQWTNTQKELQIVDEALSSLRRRFAIDDPLQHTIDTIEQSLASLLERVGAIESPFLHQENKSGGLPERNSRYEKNGSRKFEYQTKIFFHTSKLEPPFMTVIPKRMDEITLADCKTAFSRPGCIRYHFESFDPELGLVKEEILFDEDIVPNRDGNIVTWVEEIM